MTVTVVRISNVPWALETAHMARRWITLRNEQLHNCYCVCVCVCVWSVRRRVLEPHQQTRIFVPL
jgi:hypothetical protein